MVPHPQASTGDTGRGESAPGLNNSGTNTIGNASVGRGETTGNVNVAAPPPAAAAAATAASAAIAAHPPIHQQVGGQPQQQQLSPAPAVSYAYPTAPQHHGAHVIPSAFAQTPATQMVYSAPTSETPPVFQNRKLRRGKWTQEEEDYAAVLIQEFEKGAVSGCENGCTLRSFLSKKLHCAPMRISKKYAGKSIGKHVFLSRRPGNGLHGLSHRASTGREDGMLQQLEQQFYKSLFPDRVVATGSVRLSSPYSLAPYLQLTGRTLVSQANIFNHHKPMQNPNGTTYGTCVPTAPTLAVQGSTGSVPAASAPSSTIWPTTTAATTVQSSAGLHQTSQQQQAQATTEEDTRKLHQSYLDVLNQMHMNFAAAAGPQHVQQPTHPDQPTQPSQAARQPQPARHPLLRQQALPHPPASAVQQRAAPAQDAVPIAQKHAAPRAGNSNSTHGKFSGGTHDIPDILSGFDRVAAKQNGGNGATLNRDVDQSLLSSQYSPPFTSRSFDDMHQLLGQDLMHQPLNIGTSSSGNQAVPTEQVQGVPRPPMGKSDGSFDASDMASSLTADAYAVFAQESAFAVSQHSAYCRTNAVPSESGGSPPLSSGQLDAQAAAPATDKRDPGVVIMSDQNYCKSNKPPEQAAHPTSVVNAANLRAHAKAAEKTELDSSSVSSKKHARVVGVTQSYMRRAPHIVSASERSNSDMGTEESESALGSSRGSGSEDPSDNTSNDSDSISDEGPCIKKQKTCREEAQRDGIVVGYKQESLSSVSSRRGN